MLGSRHRYNLSSRLLGPPPPQKKINQFPTRINHQPAGFLGSLILRHTQIFNMMAREMQVFDNYFKVRWFIFFISLSIAMHFKKERNKQTNKQTIKFDESTEHNDDFQSQDPASSFFANHLGNPFRSRDRTTNFRLLNSRPCFGFQESVMKKILEDVEVACVQDHSASWIRTMNNQR